MREILLLCAAAGIFAGGYFFVGRIGDFLDNNRQSLSGDGRRAVLRVGLEDLTLSAAVVELLEEAAGKGRECRIEIFSGSAQDIIRDLQKKKLDLGVVAAEQENGGREACEQLFVSLRRTPVVLGDPEIPVRPLDSERLLTEIFWAEKTEDPDQTKLLQRLKHVRQIGRA